MKRVWTEVAVEQRPEGWVVLLDGRPLRTPAGNRLVVPGEGVARAVADEWLQVGETVNPDAMPMTRLATTVVDLMPARRDDAIAEAAGYAATDLLCYRAETPADLAERQRQVWQPWLDRAADRHGAPLGVVVGVVGAAQPEASLAALRAAVAALDDWQLVGLHAATTLTGSVVLGLAMLDGALDADRAFDAALLDELWEIAQWGEEEEQQRRHARLRRDLRAADRYLRLLRAAQPGG
ncbi:MAG: ATP12 family protein [Geminicoccaceae bacterium]